MPLKTTLISFKATPAFKHELEKAAEAELLSVSEYVRATVEVRLRERIKQDVISQMARGFAFMDELGFNLNDPVVMAFITKIKPEVLAGIAENENIPDDRALEMLEKALTTFRAKNAS